MPSFLFAMLVLFNTIYLVIIMHTVRIQLTDDEFYTIKAFAESKSLSIEQVLKDSFFEKLEDEYDIKCFDKEYKKYLKDRITYQSSEVKKILNIKN